MKVILPILGFVAISMASLQVFTQAIGVGANVFTPDPSAMLEVRATNKGILIPQVALTGVNDGTTISSPATSLLVYNTGTGGLSPAGYYYNAGTPAAPNWVKLQISREGWLLTGNAGTDPTINFLGTTDGKDLVIRTNNTERMRVLSGGQVLVNTTTAAAATDLFDAVGNATFTDAVNGYATVDGGIGVYGQNNVSGTGGGAGVYGISLQTGAAGVVGNGATATRGVLGITNHATYPGVQAQQQNPNGYALVALNAAANGTGTGSAISASSGQTGASTIISNLRSSSYFANAAISAYADASIANARGVIAASNNTTGVAVHGQTSGTQGIGVLGINSSTTADINATGVWGQTSNPAGTGVYGVNTSTTNNTSAIGVWGQVNNAQGSGGYFANVAAAGTNNGMGVSAYTSQSDGAAYYGRNLHNSGTGIIVAGNNVVPSHTIAGSGGAFTGSTIGVAAFKDGNLANNAGAGYFIASTSSNVGVYVAYRYGTPPTNYKIVDAGNFGGSVSTDVLGEEGLKDARLMFAPEAPEIFFMDYGRGQLVNGKAHVKLDPIFAKNIIVNDSFPLYVNIQLEGDCKGVYVTNKTNEGFDVIELQGGQSNVPFTYSITAHRRDYINPETGELISKHQGVRFPLAPKPMPIEQLKRDMKEPLEPQKMEEPKEMKEKAKTLEVKPFRNKL
jgi:hypothetical protein